ncbi:unnamed protein product [Trichogramma brassicae]|uniref:C2H2-type domain-containing protein n=1 Tax=Trichogramma brassicae TaxID=86971 RepID=A0A6H5IK86_9HYME|nr:unnamed protein product [Trichogramma brassicae]
MGEKIESAQRIPRAYFTKKMVNLVSAVKLLLLVDFPSFDKQIDVLVHKAAESIGNIETFLSSISLVVTQVQNEQQMQKVEDRLKYLVKSPKASNETASIINALHVEYEGIKDRNRLGFVKNRSVGTAAGAVIAGAASMSESLLVDSSGVDANTITALPGAVNEFLLPVSDFLVSKQKLLDKQLEKAQQMLKGLPEKEKLHIKDIEREINDSREKLHDEMKKGKEYDPASFQEMNTLREKMDDLLSKKITALEKEKELGDAKVSKQLEVIGHFQNIFSISQASVDVYQKLSSQQKNIDEVGNLIRSAEQKYHRLKQFEKQIYSVIVPVCKNIQASVDRVTEQFQGKSSAALVISKWKVQSALKGVREEIKKMTKGFKVQEEFVDIFNKVEEGINIMVQLYDIMDEYHDKAELVKFISNINDHRLGVVTNNDDLNEAVNDLMLKIQNNVVLQNYKVATNAIKHNVFPFAHELFAYSKLPEVLKTNDTDTLVTYFSNQLDDLQQKLASSDSTINQWDAKVYGNTTFNDRDGTLKPFYTQLSGTLRSPNSFSVKNRSARSLNSIIHSKKKMSFLLNTGNCLQKDHLSQKEKNPNARSKHARENGRVSLPGGVVVYAHIDISACACGEREIRRSVGGGGGATAEARDGDGGGSSSSSSSSRCCSSSVVKPPPRPTDESDGGGGGSGSSSSSGGGAAGTRSSSLPSRESYYDNFTMQECGRNTCKSHPPLRVQSAHMSERNGTYVRQVRGANATLWSTHTHVHLLMYTAVAAPPPPPPLPLFHLICKNSIRRVKPLLNPQDISVQVITLKRSIFGFAETSNIINPTFEKMIHEKCGTKSHPRIASSFRFESNNSDIHGTPTRIPDQLLRRFVSFFVGYHIERVYIRWQRKKSILILNSNCSASSSSRGTMQEYIEGARIMLPRPLPLYLVRVIFQLLPDWTGLEKHVQDLLVTHRPLVSDHRKQLFLMNKNWAVARLAPITVDVLLARGADLSNFVFPTEDYFAEISSPSYDELMVYFKISLACGALTIVERLKKGGYELDRSDALTIMKMFHKYRLFEKANFGEYWYEEVEVMCKAEEIMIRSDLSLHDLIKLRPEQAENLLAYEDYTKLERSYEYRALFQEEGVRLASERDKFCPLNFRSIKMDKSEERTEEVVSKNNSSEHDIVSSDDKQNVCDVRQDVFTLESSMITHQGTIHYEKKYFACNKCEKKFEFRSHLSRHQISEHKVHKDFACDQCEKKFVKKSILSTHQKLVHKDSKDFSCKKYGPKSEAKIKRLLIGLRQRLYATLRERHHSQPTAVCMRNLT